MESICVSIQANQYQQEELIALLSDYAPLGFEETGEALLAYFHEKDFEENPVLQVIEGYEFSVARIPARNWNEEWERNFHPVRVDDFVAVRADFHPTVTGVDYEIVITPKMSFGTGHHATTWMMMNTMRNLDFQNKIVFDFGTGTGILAILAEKMGAARVDAIDVDEWSIANAAENCTRNNCTRVHLAKTPDIPAQQYDIILANINRNVILHHLSQLKACLAPQGILVISGVLRDDRKDLMQEAGKQQLVLAHEAAREQWICLTFRPAEVNG